MENSLYHRSAFGLKVRPTMIYERTLELSSKLCWKPEDLGITKISLHDGHSFKSDSELTKYCESHGQEKPKSSHFEWLEPLKEYSGIARENYLRDEHWCNREQIINILLDTAMQAYIDESRELLSAITGANFSNAELVKFDINNHARMYIGDPDSTFVDLKNKNIALIEIKIGHSNTKYSLDQSVKYQTLETLLQSDAFFPGFCVHKLLLGPSSLFSKNTKKTDLLGPSANAEGRISFTYDSTALEALNPHGHNEISGLLSSRLQKLTRGVDAPFSYDKDNIIYFYSWKKVASLCPPGLLNRNIHALMKYLAPATE